jgi:hypothetical protein
VNFEKPDQLFEFVRDATRDAESMRTQLAQRQGLDGCYYEGIQWLTQSHFIHNRSSVSRLGIDLNPNSNKIRAVSNKTTMLTQKSAASTHPMSIEVSIEPSELNAGVEAHQVASAHEKMANAMLDQAGYLGAAQRANFRRCVFGVWGVGLAREVGPMGVRLCAFDFDPTCLVLESSCQKPDLHEHPYVQYTDTWPLDRIRRVFGVDIKPEDAATIEQLEPSKVEISYLSNLRLFSRYAKNSKAKAARVHQLHVRGDDYRFDKWYVVIEKSPDEMVWVNEDDIESPFGGMGLPFTLMHGYQRADTMWSWGEPAQIKDEQDKANLIETQNQRIIRRYAGPDRLLLDRRGFGTNTTDEDIRKQITNDGGHVIYRGSDRAINIAPPQPFPAVPPPAWLMDAVDRYGITMRDKTHKAAGNFGQMQTHIADRTVERTLDEADQVASVRVAADVAAHEYLVGVLHATQIGLVQKKNMPSIVALRKAGFDEQDFAVIFQDSAIDPSVSLKIASGSFRQRSHASRKMDLDGAAKLQMIDGEYYRNAMANDLELPLSDQDKQMGEQIRKAVVTLINTGQFMPRPMGRWSGQMLEALVGAQFDPKVKDNMAALQAIGAAIQSQYQMQYQEKLMANPELQIQAQQAAAAQAEPQEAEEPAEQVQPPQTVADLLGMISSGGASDAGSQTAAVA